MSGDKIVIAISGFIVVGLLIGIGQSVSRDFHKHNDLVVYCVDNNKTFDHIKDRKSRLDICELLVVELERGGKI